MAEPTGAPGPAEREASRRGGEPRPVTRSRVRQGGNQGFHSHAVSRESGPVQS